MTSGRQINFFLAPDDQVPFECVLRDCEDLVILKSRSNSSRPEFLSSSVLNRYGTEPLRVLLARPLDVDEITLGKISGRTEFSCDPVTSNVVEFDRCYFGGHILRPGRLFYTKNYYNCEGISTSKSEEFVVWASRLFVAAKKHLRRFGNGFYVGEGAMRLREAGVTLEGA